jgi:parvulin-like peptidyl-prolyl isomerase
MIDRRHDPVLHVLHAWRAASARVLLASACAFGAIACVHEVAREPKSLVDVASEKAAKAEAPTMIEVRVLVVAHAQAPRKIKSESRTKDQALERARMIARMAKSGDRFAELVRTYSDRPGANEDFGLFRLRPGKSSAFGQPVLDAALGLRPGQISDPVEGDEGYFVIERREDPPLGPTRVGARHILISYKGAERAMDGVTRSETEARTLAEEILVKARAGEKWEALAAEFTDEPGSKETAGDLGHFGRGQMVPAFEKAAFELAIGAVSDVVQTPFGFHVIQRYD